MPHEPSSPSPSDGVARLDVPGFLERLRQQFFALMVLIDTLFPRLPNPPASPRETILYLQRTQTRFQRLLARLAAGIKPRQRPSRAKPPEAEPKPRKNPRLRLPQRKAWLNNILLWQGRNHALSIAILLDEPATAALVAASPQAHRLLRPLCRMLAIAPACIPPLPKRPRAPRPKQAAKPRRLTRKQHQAILWYPNSEGKPMDLLPRARSPGARIPID